MWIVQQWKSFIVWFVIIVIAGGAVSTSEAFQDCEHTHKNHKAYRALYEKRSIGIKAIVRLELHAACTVKAAHENEGPLTLLATILIAGFTGTLWFETNRLYRAGEKQIAITQISADAARRSADALVSSERPWMIATVERKRLTPAIESAIEHGPSNFEVSITFVNEGRTTAFIGIFHAEAAISDYPKPPNGVPFIIDNEHKAIGKGEDIKFPLGVGLSITRDDAIKIREGSAVIWLFGYLEYSDFFQQERTTYFCFDHNMGMGCVYPWGDKKENYMT